MVKIAIFRKLLFFPRRFLNNEVEVKVDLQIIEAIKIVDNFSFPPLFSIFFHNFSCKICGETSRYEDDVHDEFGP